MNPRGVLFSVKNNKVVLAEAKKFLLDLLVCISLELSSLLITFLPLLIGNSAYFVYLINLLNYFNNFSADVVVLAALTLLDFQNF